MLQLSISKEKKQLIWLSSYSDADGTTHEFCNYANTTGEFLWRQGSIITLMLILDYKLVNLPELDDPFLLRRLFWRMRQKLNSKIPVRRERNDETYITYTS
jgi:hypothetical protein